MRWFANDAHRARIQRANESQRRAAVAKASRPVAVVKAAPSARDIVATAKRLVDDAHAGRLAAEERVAAAEERAAAAEERADTMRRLAVMDEEAALIRKAIFANAHLVMNAIVHVDKKVDGVAAKAAATAPAPRVKRVTKEITAHDDAGRISTVVEVPEYES